MAATLFFSVLSLGLFLAATAAPHGFTADLIRRDSPETLPLRLRSRRLAASASNGSPFADTIVGSGEYLMKIQIGTPPLEILGILDTGSDLIWTQCLPCVRCFNQDAPKFNPISSSTYKDVTCRTSQCQNVKPVQCGAKDEACPYEAFYGDPRTFSIGTIGTDTVTLHSTSGEPFVMPETVVGCGHNNSMPSSDNSGIIGLGWGPASLVSQMGDAIEGLFSYCLGAKTSKINFGENAVVSGEGTVSTTLFRKHNRPGNYFLNLEAVSVDKSRVGTSGTSFQATDGNIMIDSGTTRTYLPMDYYLRVKAALDTAVKAAPAEGFPSKLCYKTSILSDFPVITMHFTGADLVLEQYNTYRSPAPGVTCLMFLPADDLIPPIFGNQAHSGFLVGYDTQSEMISFKPTDCSAL